MRHPVRYWCVGLLLAIVVGATVNAAMARIAQHMRARDYRVDLAKAHRLTEAGQYDAALNAAADAIRKAPSRPEPLEAQGHIQYRLHNWQEAIAAFTAAADAGSRDPGIRQMTVWAFVELQRYSDAAFCGETAIADGLGTPLLSRCVGEALFRGERFAESVPYLQHSLESASNDLYLWEHLRQACERAGYEDMAQQAAQAIQSLHTKLSLSQSFGGRS